MWNCLANTRNLISARLFQGIELGVQEEQAEGMEEGGVRTGMEAFRVHPAGAPEMPGSFPCRAESRLKGVETPAGRPEGGCRGV